MHFNRRDLVAIACGGIAGASLRWLITRTPDAAGDWFTYAPNSSIAYEFDLPLRTLIANMLGCLVLGACTYLLARAKPERPRLLLGAATGFCGSLTTFSSFAVEIAHALRLSDQDGIATTVTYVILSIGGGGLAFWLGRLAADRIVNTPGLSTIGGRS